MCAVVRHHLISIDFSSFLEGGEVVVLTHGVFFRNVRFKVPSSSARRRAALGATITKMISQRSAYGSGWGLWVAALEPARREAVELGHF